MKKLGIGAVVFLGLLILIWVLARATDTLQFYSVSTGSNEPTFKIGKYFLVSKYKQPHKLDFVCFNCFSPITHEKHRWFFRLVGIQGDKIEIRKGTLYVNNVNLDAGLNLNHAYIHKNTSNEYLPPSNAEFISNTDTGSLFFIDDDFVKHHSWNIHRYVLPADYKDEYIDSAYGKEWNADNFGPVTVPKDSYFLLGDNRNNALDCRYIGFVSKDDFVGTVLGK